jgi:hypothetical protein
MRYTGIPTQKLLHHLHQMALTEYPVICCWRGKDTKKPCEQIVQGAYRSLTRFEELVCALTRLRTGWTAQQVADHFDVSQSFVLKLFVTYMYILDELTVPLRQWPDTDVI